MYFPISNTWIVKQTPFGALLALWLQTFSFQWMMWLFLIWLGWGAKGRHHSFSKTEYLFHLSHAKHKAASFWSCIRINSLLANNNELTVLWDCFSLHVHLLQEKSLKLVRALSSNLMESAAKAYNDKTVKPSDLPRSIKIMFDNFQQPEIVCIQ